MKIEKGVKIPDTARRDWSHVMDMKPGDSFFVPGLTATDVSNAIAYYRRAYGGRYAQRTLTEKKQRGVRVWCLEPAKRREK